MGVVAKNIVSQEAPKNIKTLVSKDDNKLSKEELELLLALIKRSQFLGEHVEIVYNLTVKIQNQYLEESK